MAPVAFPPALDLTRSRAYPILASPRPHCSTPFHPTRGIPPKPLRTHNAHNKVITSPTTPAIAQEQMNLGNVSPLAASQNPVDALLGWRSMRRAMRRAGMTEVGSMRGSNMRASNPRQRGIENANPAGIVGETGMTRIGTKRGGRRGEIGSQAEVGGIIERIRTRTPGILHTVAEMQEAARVQLLDAMELTKVVSAEPVGAGVAAAATDDEAIQTDSPILKEMDRSTALWLNVWDSRANAFRVRVPTVTFLFGLSCVPSFFPVGSLHRSSAHTIAISLPRQRFSFFLPSYFSVSSSPRRHTRCILPLLLGLPVPYHVHFQSSHFQVIDLPHQSRCPVLRLCHLPNFPLDYCLLCYTLLSI
ncbi:hypothetical protein FA13DRAFT_1360290 [Coprinellus micaceus]|uniref:Uncharacterized protein n=1 Tax=Coprinellus micaceus TaxID=71717 RepID=A0A4Y7TNV9_COPMI|nr:hypothetical protein FA13DRAFT_1360290 [Coprinellus micaceus]